MGIPALLLVVAAAQQPAPAEVRARDLLKKLQERLTAAHALRYAATMNGERWGRGAAGEATLAVRLRERDRVRLEADYRCYGEPARIVIVARDREAFEYRSAVSEHRSQKLEAGIESTFMPDPAGHFYLGGSVTAWLPVGGGQPGTIWEVAESGSTLTVTCRLERPSEAGLQSVAAVWTLDAGGPTLRSWTLERKSGATVVSSQRVAYSELVLDPPLAESHFLFDPPADSKKVEGFRDPALVRLNSFVGKAFPDLELAGEGGAKQSLAERIRGSVALVVVWNSVHPDCLMAINHLNVVHDRFNPEGVRIVLVSNEGEEEVKEFRRRSQTRPRWERPLFRIVGPFGEPFSLPDELPAVFLVDRKGVLRCVFLGGSKTSQRYVREVGNLLGE